MILLQGHGTTCPPHANGHEMEAFGHGMPCPYRGWVNGYLGRRLCPRYCHTLEYSIVTPVNIVLSRPRPREGKKALKHEEEDDDENEDELCDLIVSSVLSTPSASLVPLSQRDSLLARCLRRHPLCPSETGTRRSAATEGGG